MIKKMAKKNKISSDNFELFSKAIKSGGIKSKLDEYKKKKIKSKPVNIVITKCENENFWYFGQEGTIYEVEIFIHKNYARTVIPIEKNFIYGCIFYGDYEILKH